MIDCLQVETWPRGGGWVGRPRWAPARSRRRFRPKRLGHVLEPGIPRRIGGMPRCASGPTRNRPPAGLPARGSTASRRRRCSWGQMMLQHLPPRSCRPAQHENKAFLNGLSPPGKRPRRCRWPGPSAHASASLASTRCTSAPMAKGEFVDQNPAAGSTLSLRVTNISGKATMSAPAGLRLGPGGACLRGVFSGQGRPRSGSVVQGSSRNRRSWGALSGRAAFVLRGCKQKPAPRPRSRRRCAAVLPKSRLRAPPPTPLSLGRQKTRKQSLRTTGRAKDPVSRMTHCHGTGCHDRVRVDGACAI